MRTPGPDLPGAVPFGPAVVMLAGARWYEEGGEVGLLIDCQLSDGRPAGSLCFTSQGGRVRFNAAHPVSMDGQERLHEHMLRDCHVNATVAQDAMSELIDTLQDILADVRAPSGAG